MGMVLLIALSYALLVSGTTNKDMTEERSFSQNQRNLIQASQNQQYDHRGYFHKEDSCEVITLKSRQYISPGIIQTVPESNMNFSMTQKFCRYTLRELERDGSIVKYLCTREKVLEFFQINPGQTWTLFPGYGMHAPKFLTSAKARYTTGFFKNNRTCFWGKSPSISPNATDYSLWKSNLTVEHVDKAIISGDFFNNFFHALVTLNKWCEIRNQKDLHFLVQSIGGGVPKYLPIWMERIGLGNQFVHHVGPISADMVYSMSFDPQAVDWSCLHGLFGSHNTSGEYAVIYQRIRGSVRRNIPIEISKKFAKALTHQLPSLRVKIFDGRLSFAEAQRLFSKAKVFIGPHGAGFANLIFCPDQMAVIEFVTEKVFRPWQMYGGHSIHFAWWPVLIRSFDSEDEILQAVHIVQIAINMR